MKTIVLIVLAIILTACTILTPLRAETIFKVYLPLVSKVRQEEARLAGVYAYNRNSTTVAIWIHSHSPVKSHVRWDVVEEVRGVYDWSVPDARMAGLLINEVVVMMTPDWALEPGQPLCKLPKREHWDDFAIFANAVRERYGGRVAASGVQSAVEYEFIIELWNEPDFDTSESPLQIYFGCVVDGTLYAEFVNHVGPQIEGATVVAGAVGNVRGQFTDDMLAWIDPAAYDVFSYHCYASFWLTLDEALCFDLYDLAVQKSEKPVVLSETGVLYYVGQVESYDLAQVRYFNLLEERMKVTWYWFTICCNGWPQAAPTDLVYRTDGVYVPQPVWYTYMEYYNELRGNK